MLGGIYDQAWRACVATSFLLSGTAQAATQGSQGATSTGTALISATVPNRAQISKLSDVTFAPTDLTVAASSAQNVCVWSNTSLKKYNITATGSGAQAFTLAAAALRFRTPLRGIAAAGNRGNDLGGGARSLPRFRPRSSRTARRLR